MAKRIRVAHLLIAGGLVLGASPAFAQEGSLIYNFMQGVFGKGEGADIDYRARAPLVVPPNSTLPRPQQAASERNAAWPNDPDVQRRKDAANPAPYVEPHGLRNNARLSAEEFAKVGRRVSRGDLCLAKTTATTTTSSSRSWSVARWQRVRPRSTRTPPPMAPSRRVARSRSRRRAIVARLRRPPSARVRVVRLKIRRIPASASSRPGVGR